MHLLIFFYQYTFLCINELNQIKSKLYIYLYNTKNVWDTIYKYSFLLNLCKLSKFKYYNWIKYIVN